MWGDAGVLGPDHGKSHDMEDGVWHTGQSQLRISPMDFAVSNPGFGGEPSPSTRTEDIHGPSSDIMQSLSDFSSLPLSPQIPTEETLLLPAKEMGTLLPLAPRPKAILYQTVQPCAPAICATEVEGSST